MDKYQYDLELSKLLKIINSREFVKINDDILNRYLNSLEYLKSFPNSTRIFNEAFEKGLSLVKKYGTGLGLFGFGPKLLTCHYSADQNKIFLSYHKSKKTDDLSTVIINPNNSNEPKESFVMFREKGYLTMKKFDNTDPITRMTSGENIFNFMGNMRQYEPRGLIIKNNDLNIVNAY